MRTRVLSDPLAAWSSPLDCVHLIAAEPHHARPPGEEMTDTPGHRRGHVQDTPGDGNPNNLTHHHHTPVVQPPRPTNGLAYGETPLDKPRSFRDDNREVFVLARGESAVGAILC